MFRYSDLMAGMCISDCGGMLSINVINEKLESTVVELEVPDERTSPDESSDQC